MGTSSSALKTPFNRPDPGRRKLPSTGWPESPVSKNSLSPTSDRSESTKSDMTDKISSSKEKSLESLKQSAKASTSSLLKPKEPVKPTKAQLERWISSINSLLSDPDGMQAFEVFLGESESDEGEFKKYLHFYRECSEFQRKLCELENEAVRIFETYLEVGSEFEIGTDKECEKVEKKIKIDGFPQKSLFDESLRKVKNTLDNTHYVNFCLYLKEKYKL